MKLAGINELVFKAAQTGDWSNVPLDTELLYLRNGEGDTPTHVAAKHGLANQIPPILRIYGLFLVNKDGVMAEHFLQPDDMCKFQWENEKQARLFTAKMKWAGVMLPFRLAFQAQCPCLN